jgi:hypothetical protein
VNTPICTNEEEQIEPVIVSDGENGAIIFWSDRRSQSQYDIYAQRVDSMGYIQWQPNGIPICTTSHVIYKERLKSILDKDGNILLIWYAEWRDGNISHDNIFVQKINKNGSILWNSTGIQVVSSTRYKSGINVCTDDSGGVIVTWHELTQSNQRVYVQRVDESGNLRWGDEGIILSSNSYDPVIAPDNVGGAIITWVDLRDQYHDLYAQRIDCSGNRLWDSLGVPVCTEIWDQHYPAIVSDDSGGVIVAWMDGRNSSWDVYAQRLKQNGDTVWKKNGVPVCQAPGQEGPPIKIISDNKHGAFLAWTDSRSSRTSWDIYVQHLFPDGTINWALNGVAAVTALGGDISPSIISDGANGVIVSCNGNFVYGQQIDSSGINLWEQEGLIISSSENNSNVASISDGFGGAIFAWIDERNGPDGDVFVQRVDRNGRLGIVTAIKETDFFVSDFSLSQNFPNPFNPSTQISFTLPTQSFVSLKVYDILGRELSTLFNSKIEAGEHVVRWDGTNRESGLYVYRLVTENHVETRKMLLAK